MKYKNYLRILILLSLLFLIQENFANEQQTNNGWKKELNEQLQLMGHRNWILVVDAAYPLQSNPAIKTVDTGAEHLMVVKEVLAEIDNAPHVAPQIYLDQELDYVPEEEAPGIGNYKTKLKNILKDKDINSMPHEDIIYMLDEAAETFGVLVLKSSFTLPYTSVFINLNCGYWTPQQETKLRQLIRK